VARLTTSSKVQGKQHEEQENTQKVHTAHDSTQHDKNTATNWKLLNEEGRTTFFLLNFLSRFPSSNLWYLRIIINPTFPHSVKRRTMAEGQSLNKIARLTAEDKVCSSSCLAYNEVRKERKKVRAARMESCGKERESQ